MRNRNVLAYVLIVLGVLIIVGGALYLASQYVEVVVLLGVIAGLLCILLGVLGLILWQSAEPRPEPPAKSPPVSAPPPAPVAAPVAAGALPLRAEAKPLDVHVRDLVVARANALTLPYFRRYVLEVLEHLGYAIPATTWSGRGIEVQVSYQQARVLVRLERRPPGMTVGVDAVREVQAALVQQRIPRGLILTTGGVYPETAHAEARALPAYQVILVPGAQFAEWGWNYGIPDDDSAKRGAPSPARRELPVITVTSKPTKRD